MASTQTEPEASRNGPEAKEMDGPSTNGVEAQRDMDSSSTNGPAAPPLTNNGPHDPADKMQSAGSYYKAPPTSGYPPAAGYESNQYGYPHGYMHQQPGELQHQQPGSYPYSQYPGSNVRNMAPVASKPTSYMPRNPAAPVSGYPPANQGYPPSRYPTPTLNQLLQPGSGPPVQRYPYGDYPQQTQQPPANSHVPNWNMQQQPRGYAPAPGFKPPPNAMPQQSQYPAYGPGMQPGPPQRYPSVPASTPIHPQQQDTVKSSTGEPPGDSTNANNQRNSSSPSTTTASSTTPSAVSSSPTPTTTSVGASSATTVNSPAAGGRPDPSPSPANRPMSPALGPANSNSSSSNHNASPSPAGDNNSSGQARMSHSPMAAQGAYQQPMPPPPHVAMPPYKMSPGPYQQAPPPPPQQQPAPGQPQQPQYLPNPMYMQRPPGPPNMYGPPGAPYGPPSSTAPTGPAPPPNSTNANNPMPPASPGPNRPMGPHMGPPTPYPGYPSQYGGQQPAWGPNSMPGGPPGSPMQPSHGGKGALPPPPGPTGPPTPGPRPTGPPHTPPHYTKQHLQHHLQQQQQQKMYGMAPSPGSGPPNATQQPPNASQQQIMGPYPPPGMPNAGSITGHPPSAASPVTNIVTTGPDGVAGLDEASQQSTLSNTSQASGDDGSTPSTPRPQRKETVAAAPASHHPPFSHPATPQSTAPSPGAGLQPAGQHDDFREGTSPAPNSGNWKPTPASPVRTPETKKSHVSDALAKLYEFDDHPDRRKFIDQLLRFMDEKGTPITACPAISKNPLDLFRLYLLVRERGGFLEVTKNKTWKDIAQTLGIGASSSAAYTLRKHYTKSLFPWECKFDRGGVDPQPILNQVEASTKKKPPSKALSVPSPAGSSNSQDSFPASGVPPIPSMDGYPNSHYPGYPPPHGGENIAASNPFDDQQHHYGGRPAHPGYPPPPPPPGPQQGQPPAPQAPQQPAGPAQQQQQPPAQPMYGPMPNRPGYPGMSQGYPHHPYQGEYPNNQQYPPYPPNRTMYPPYGEPYNAQGPPPPSGQAPPPPGAPPGAGPDPYGRYMPPNATAPPPNAPYMPRPPAPASAPATAAPPHAQPMPPQSGPVQQPAGNTSAGPSPAPSPAPNVVAPNYAEQNDQYQQRSGLRQLLATSPLAQQLATPSTDNRQPGYGGAPTNLGPPTGQPYPGLIRPGTPGPTSAPPRPTAPTPPNQPPNAMVQPAPGPPPAPGPQQPGQAPYPPYGPPGQPGSQPRQPYGWRGPAPYGNQYPPAGPPGTSPGPVQTAGAPWVPPTGNQQPRNPAWDQTQRYPGPMPASPAAPYNGTSQSGPGAPATPGMQQQMAPQAPGAPPNQQQWSSPNARPPFPRPPYRPADGKPYPMPPMPGKPMMQQYPQSPMQMYQPKSQFPPDSVEAVTPVMSKRRRLCRADVAPVDAWRVYLSLKSGLLAESTWAIDVLNVLLFDDASVHYFSLGYMPGLLEVLLEHFRRVLSEIFSILEDIEIGYDRIEELNNTRSKRKALSNEKTSGNDGEENAWWVRKRPEPEEVEDHDLGAVKANDLAGERVRMLDGPDLSLAARRREKIGIVSRDKELFISDKRKEWDIHEGFESGTDQWQMGGGDTTQHIVTHFTAELNIIPFVRVMKKSEKRPESPAVVEEKVNKEPEVKLSTPKNCLTVKKTRSLADVLQRIKKEANDVEAVDETPKEEVKQIEKEIEIKKEPVEEVEKEVSNEEEAPKDLVEKPKLQLKDPHSTLKRKSMDDYEDECYTRDETSLYSVDDSQDGLSRRALALSNILRSLSFLPTNELELARNPTLLVIVGKLLLLHHDHPLRSANQKNYDREEDVDFASDPSTPSTTTTKADDWWWMDTLLALRENALVVLANIAGQLDLSNYSEEIVRPLIDGLLHWAVCPSAQAQDPFGSFGPNSTSLLSPQRLSLEAMCKLLVLEANVDLILATPPFSRLEKLVHFLTKSLCRTEDQVLREFAVNVLYYLSAADSGMARLISMHNNSLSLLVSFVEQAETNAMVVASQHGIQALRENPESMGTSLDMLRRAASTIFHIARHPESKQLINKLEQRLLSLVMSQIMDQSVAAILSRSLYLCNTDDD